MVNTDFIFTSGLWLGEGKITLGTSKEFIKFYTKWVIDEPSSGVMRGVQTVEMLGIEEHVVNTFIFSHLKPTSFEVSLENPQLAEKVIGTGIRNERTIAWEFRGNSALEGFEVYERQANGDYFIHAEYGSSSEFRTLIEGLIWQKNLVQ